MLAARTSNVERSARTRGSKVALHELGLAPLLALACASTAHAQTAPEAATVPSAHAPAPVAAAARAQRHLLARLEFPTANGGEAKPAALLAGDFDGDGRDELLATTRGPGSLQLWSGLSSALAPFPEPRVLAIGDYALGPVWFGGARPDRTSPSKHVVVAPRAQPPEILEIDPKLLSSGAGDPIVRRIPLARRPRALTTGDLFADRKPEIVVATIDDELLVYGAGAEPTRIVCGEQLPTCLRVLEDGSGIVAGFQGSRRIVLWNAARGANGALTFARGPMATLPGLPRDMDEFDVDSDGDTELVVVGGDEYWWIFGLGHPGGVAAGLRAEPETTTTGAIPIDIEHRALGVDQGSELCVLALGGLNYNLYHAAPEGRSATGTWYAGQSPVDAAYGDFDGDGAADIAFANSDATRVSVVFGDGTGGYVNAPFANTGRTPHSLAAGDLDGDGFRELLVLNAADGTLSIARNKNGVLQHARGKVLARSADSLQVADLDGEPGLEAAFITLGETTSALTVLFGTDGNLFERANFPPVPIGVSQGDLLLVDVDSDGKVDAIATDPKQNRVVWLRNETEKGGTLKLVAAAGADAPAHPKGLAILDAPSELAVALLGPGARTGVAVLRLDRDAQGAFAWNEISSVDTIYPPLALAASDLNGDGRRDLAILISERGADTKCFVVTALRREDGNWDRLEPFPVGFRPYRVVSGDIDGDGRGEILVSAQNSHHVELWTSQAPFDGKFLRTADLGLHAGCLDVLLADLDQDRALEIVVANGFSNDVGVVKLR